jgi:hypothetical protein
VHDEPVLVAGYVEDNPVVANKVHCVPKVSLYVGRAIPIGVPDIGEPSLKGPARLREKERWGKIIRQASIRLE